MNDYAINHRASRPLLDGAALDTAIDEARAALAALLRAPGGGEPSRLTEARALLGTLLDRRVALAAARLDDRDAAAIATARADRDEAIAVTGALLYWLPAGDATWPEVALMTWGERLMTFPDAGGLGQSGLHGMLELELLDRDEVPAGSWGPWAARPARLAATLV